MPRTVERFSSNKKLRQAVRVFCENHLQERFELRWRDISGQFLMKPPVLKAIGQIRLSLKRIAGELPKLRTDLKTAQRERTAASQWHGFAEAERVVAALSFLDGLPSLNVPDSRRHVVQCAARASRWTGSLGTRTSRDLAVISLLYGNWPSLAAALKKPSVLDVVRQEERYLRQYAKQKKTTTHRPSTKASPPQKKDKKNKLET